MLTTRMTQLANRVLADQFFPATDSSAAGNRVSDAAEIPPVVCGEIKSCGQTNSDSVTETYFAQANENTSATDCVEAVNQMTIPTATRFTRRSYSAAIFNSVQDESFLDDAMNRSPNGMVYSTSSFKLSVNLAKTEAVKSHSFTTTQSTVSETASSEGLRRVNLVNLVSPQSLGSIPPEEERSPSRTEVLTNGSLSRAKLRASLSVPARLKYSEKESPGR